MLAGDRHTPYKDGGLIALPVAAGKTIYAGALVVATAAGFAAPGSTALNLAYMGRAEEQVSNADGADGDQTVRVRRGLVFRWANSGADPVDQSGVGKPCYIVDDETVSATDGGGAQSAAGTVIEIDEDGGVWVE